MTSDGRRPFLDPHFHLWDLELAPNPNLGGVEGQLPVYSARDYAEEWLDTTFRVEGAVHIETIVGQCDSGPKLDSLAETKRVVEAASSLDFPVKVCPYVHLGRDDAARVLEAHLAAGKGAVAGVRMIANYRDGDSARTYPQVDQDYVLEHAIDRGLGALAERGLLFELQCNPEQLVTAAALTRRHPGVPIVLNHVGCPRLMEGDVEARSREWRAWWHGITALASAHPRVYCKLSMLDPVAPNWTKDPEAAALVRRVLEHAIATFGAARCMLASNYPVDKLAGASTGRTLEQQLDSTIAALPRHLTDADVEELLSGTSRRVYGFGKGDVCGGR